jgi:predicted metal-dependent phosphoesterase TrpH
MTGADRGEDDDALPASGRAGLASEGRSEPASAVDLHTHSTYSDGLLAPAELVAEAARVGLRALALTDHDTVAGIAEATGAAASAGIELVPGVELSSGGGDEWPEIHLLGYFVDPTDPGLLAGLAAYADHRLARLERIVARLDALGATIEPDLVRRLAGPGTVGRPHVARALVETGRVGSMGEAFERYLGRGRPAFVPRPKVEPGRAIAQIGAAGGVAVLAHPLAVGDVEAVLSRLVPLGLVGLEADYGEYDPATRAALRQVADHWRLIATGGSDFHGPGFRAGRDLGRPWVAPEAVERLRAAADRGVAPG